MTPTISRRTVLAGAAAGLVAGRPAQAQTAPGLRLGGFRCDVSGLLGSADPSAVELVAQVMPAKLSYAFSDLAVSDRAAPILVARVTRLFLAFFAGPEPTGGSATQNMDEMNGLGIVASGRAILSSTPLHVALAASYSGPYYLPDINARRVDSICYQFAYWLRREMQV